MKLRLGVIGAGAWTVASHLPNLRRRADEIDFVAVNNLDPERLESIRRRYGFEIASTDYREVLAAGVDICVVASPARWHHEHARAALEAGAHVLVEKPFTIDPAHAWDLANTADRLGLHLLVSFGANYQPMIRGAKQLMVTGGGIGAVEHVMIHMASAIREAFLGHPRPYALDELPEGAPELHPDPDTSATPELAGGGYAQAQLSHQRVAFRSRERMYEDVLPPSAMITAPVKKDDSSLARCRIVGAISSGSAQRLNRFMLWYSFMASSETPAIIGVFTSPGQTTFTRIPSEAWSSAVSTPNGSEFATSQLIRSCCGPRW